MLRKYCASVYPLVFLCFGGFLASGSLWTHKVSRRFRRLHWLVCSQIVLESFYPILCNFTTFSLTSISANCQQDLTLLAAWPVAASWFSSFYSSFVLWGHLLTRPKWSVSIIASFGEMMKELHQSLCALIP